MKLLVTSDLHVHSWTKFSNIDQYGRPDRLLKYLELAKDIGTLAKDKNCDAIILAGDISERCIQPPHTLDVIGDFLRSLASFKPVYLIHGQHDLNTKTDSISFQNSILKEICKDLEDCNVFYFGETGKLELKGKTIVFQPWTEDHSIPELSGDVFVGHGLVSGIKNLDGHIFSSGFNAEELTKRFKLSIIGDIHNGQVFSNETGKVLIPGCPIQNTWKDAYNSGIWTAELKEKEPILEFFNIHELHPNFYHQFVYDQPSSELIHSRPLIGRERVKSEKKEHIKLERNLDTIYDTCLKIVDEDKVNSPIRVKEALRDAFDNLKPTEDNIIANTKIKSISIKNFLSIDEFSLDFTEFPHTCVIIGANGSGKTSLPEAVYWGLTGTTTKDIALSNIVNTFKGEVECSVSIELEIGTNQITVVRKRDKSSSSLELEQNGSPFNRGSMRETQQEIYNLLGLSDWQIKMFSYFSAQKTSLFAGLGDSAKNDLLSQIVGLNFLEAIREYSKTKKNKFKEEILKSQGFLSSLDFQVSSLQSKLSKLSLELKNDSNETLNKEIISIKNKISILNGELQLDISNYTGVISELEKYQVADLIELQKKIGELSNEYNRLSSLISNSGVKRLNLTSSLNSKKSDLKKSLLGICHTCEQPVKDDTLINTLKQEVSSIVKSLSEIPKEEELTERANLLEVEINLLSNYQTKLVKINSEISKKKNELQILSGNLGKLSLELQKEKQDNSILEHVREELKSSENEKSKHEGLLLDYQISQDVWKYIEVDLLKKKGNLIKKLNEQGSILIQKCVNELLTDTNFDVKIDEDLTIQGKFYNSKWMSYEALSSGQKRVVDIILMVALNNLFSKIYNLDNGVLGLAVYDEILSFLDPEFIEISKGIIDQSISEKILMITHDENLINMYDSKISVSMGKLGSIYNKSW